MAQIQARWCSRRGLISLLKSQFNHTNEHYFQGVPLASDDMLFSPTVSRPAARQLGSFAPPPEQIRPEIASRKQSANGIIPHDEDVRRLFQECKIGRGNAQLLNEALAFAAPEDLREKEIIKVRLVPHPPYCC